MEPNDPNNPWNNNPYSPDQNNPNQNPYSNQNPNQPNYNQPNQQYNQQQQYNPYNQQGNQYNQGQYPPPSQNPFFQNQVFGNQIDLPNAQTILVLGICSIVMAFCYGVIGLILGIISLVLGNKGMQQYNANPGMYTTSSYNNLKAGRICGIVGLSLGALVIVYIILMFAVFASAFSGIGGFN